VKVTALADVAPRPRRIAVGEFDGVHLGHREVIRGSDTVLTFEPHPLAVIHPQAAPRLLTSLEIKSELMADLGVQELVLIPFDDSFAHQTPEAFIDDVLIGTLQATHVSVGENFRFGHEATGDTGLLEAQPTFVTRIVPLVEFEHEIVSSTHIRGLVVAGEVDHAARFLGGPFQIRGEVVHGDKRGRALGFPTANLVPADGLIYPGHGVYACVAHLPASGGQPIAAAVNVGVRPQFQTGRAVLVEAFLIDWSGDIYGQDLHLDFLTRLRGERRFPSVEDLVGQMGRDVEEARAIVRSSATVSGR
jgi:riboflavin kinase/FMN adenylyltransferase